MIIIFLQINVQKPVDKEILERHVRLQADPRRIHGVRNSTTISLVQKCCQSSRQKRFLYSNNGPLNCVHNCKKLIMSSYRNIVGSNMQHPARGHSVATCCDNWVLLALSIFKLEPTTPNMSQPGYQTCATYFVQQCCDMLS